jgi:hypothetical protein
VYVALALATIVVGLVVHLATRGIGAAERDMLGDALWAAMIAWWLGAFAPDARLMARGVVAYAICAAVEVSQLYHAPALDALRETRVGHLVLGSGFDSRDLLSYAFGVAGAMLLEVAARNLRRQGGVSRG